MNDYYMIDEDDISRIEMARGCNKCKLYSDWLPGCPHYCAKWALEKDEAERDEREKQIVREYEERRKK